MIIKLQRNYSQESSSDEDKNTLKAKDLLAPGVATASAAGLSQYAHKSIENSKLIDNYYDSKKRVSSTAELTEKEKSKIKDYLQKYAKEKWGDDLAVVNVDPIKRNNRGYYKIGDIPSNLFAKTGLTPEEFEKIAKEHPELITEGSKLFPKYMRSFPTYIYLPSKSDVFTFAHELGHREIDKSKSKSLLDFWEKVAQKLGGVSEGLSDNKTLKNVKNVAIPLTSTVPFGFYVDDKDDDKIKLNKNSLIAPGALMAGDSLVPVFEAGATRRGIELMKNSGVVDPEILNKVKEFDNYHNYTIEHKKLRAQNLASLAVTTGLGLGVSRLNAQLLKNKKLRESEKDKENREKYLIIPTNSQYLIPRKDKYKGLTEEEIKRKKKAGVFGTIGEIGVSVGSLYGGLSLNTLKKSEELGKRAGMQEIADRLKNSNAKMKVIIPSSLMLAGGIGSSIYANKLNKRIKTDNDKKTKSYSDTERSEEEEEKLNDRIKGSIYSGASGGLLGLGAVYGAEKIGDKIFYNKSIKLSNKNEEFFKKEREINPDFRWGWGPAEEELRKIKTPELKEGLEKWLKLQKLHDKFRAIKNKKPLPQLVGLTSGIGGGVGLYNLYKNKKENKENKEKN